MFIVEINNYDLKTRLIELSDALFQPFEINSDDFYAPTYEIDPDINFYNEIDYHIGSTCNYYMEDAFSSIKEMYTSEPSEKLFSICHLNIRSLQSNLNDFDMYLKSLNFVFLSASPKPGYKMEILIYMSCQVMYFLRDIDIPGKVVVLEYLKKMMFLYRIKMIYIQLMICLNQYS